MSEERLFAAQSFPEVYERVLVAPLFRPFAEDVLAGIDLRSGDRIIDVACGTGIVARLARERLGPEARVVGVDLSPAMLAVARSVAPSIDWRQGDAAALPVETEETFTVLTCQQGLQFMPDKPAAVREMRRVLRPGGRVAIATWASLDELPTMRALNAIAERHVGPIVDSRHSFGDAETLRALLVDAGFRNVRVEAMTHDVLFDEGASFARLNAMAVIGMSATGRSMSEVARGALAEQIARESEDVITESTTTGQFAFPLRANIAFASA